MLPMLCTRRFHVSAVSVLLLGLGLGWGSLRAQAPADASESDGPLQQSRAAQDVSRPRPLTNDTILRMGKAGLDDTVILQAIATQPSAYDTAPDDLIALKNAGLSQQVIAAMQARGAGLAVHANPVEVAPLGAGVDEIGVYYKDKTGQWVPLRTERVQFKSGGWIKSTVTNNIVKQDLNGHVDGAKSPLTVPTGVQLLIYTPAGTQAEEYDLLRFREHGGGREFRVKTGGVFHTETGSERDEIEFHPQKISKQMYQFTVPADIEKGEYGVLPPGSSNTPGVANAGKIFTFSIRE